MVDLSVAILACTWLKAASPSLSEGRMLERAASNTLSHFADASADLVPADGHEENEGKEMGIHTSINQSHQTKEPNKLPMEGTEEVTAWHIKEQRGMQQH
jgi:hypothetical protein